MENRGSGLATKAVIVIVVEESVLDTEATAFIEDVRAHAIVFVGMSVVVMEVEKPVVAMKVIVAVIDEATVDVLVTRIMTVLVLGVEEPIVDIETVATIIEQDRVYLSNGCDRDGGHCCYSTHRSKAFCSDDGGPSARISQKSRLQS
ncbi:hypothetical protein QAD02_019376 [Eretmocerus hayati]|uniref:Uncharacterized protein n=1 Tax=Eretmocerus hayati TaxID=131215 RepID=A0ACC2PLY1_9HYME|nr:hypothetical protein QAD02_019376 [Eretmocerus hayati]